MNTTTVILLNGILAVGLLAALALVMHLGHRVAGLPESAAAARWPNPLEPDLLPAADPQLERAA
jgi:hypothetical protein